MSETKHTTLKEINGGNFRGELSKTERGALLVTITRSFFYAGKMISQKIQFLAQQLEELEFMNGQLKAERDKITGNPSTLAATPGHSGNGKEGA